MSVVLPTNAAPDKICNAFVGRCRGPNGLSMHTTGTHASNNRASLLVRGRIVRRSYGSMLFVNELTTNAVNRFSAWHLDFVTSRVSLWSKFPDTIPSNTDVEIALCNYFS